MVSLPQNLKIKKRALQHRLVCNAGRHTCNGSYLMGSILFFIAFSLAITLLALYERLRAK
jgi:hypothetical protein